MRFKTYSVSSLRPALQEAPLVSQLPSAEEAESAEAGASEKSDARCRSQWSIASGSPRRLTECQKAFQDTFGVDMCGMMVLPSHLQVDEDPARKMKSLESLEVPWHAAGCSFMVHGAC